MNQIKQSIFTITLKQGASYTERQGAINNFVQREFESLRNAGLYPGSYKVTRTDENSASVIIEYTERG